VCHCKLNVFVGTRLMQTLPFHPSVRTRFTVAPGE